MKKVTRIIGGVAGLGLLGTAALSGCAADASDAGSADAGDKGTITLGYLPSWTDGLSMAYLVDDQLQKLGYDVEHLTFTDNGPMFVGLSNGDFDVYPSTWPEVNQKAYVDEYGDDLEDLGAWSESATVTVAVPAYSEIDSIDELLAHADEFDGKIYTVEPGAGTTKTAQESLFPAYGLDAEFDLITSSTAGMLASLDTAISAGDEVAVTLWRPFWPYTVYDLKDLDDPEGAMGTSQTMNFYAHKGFSEQYPDAAELMGEIVLDDDQYAALEHLVVNEFGEGHEAEAVDAWIADHADEFDWIIE